MSAGPNIICGGMSGTTLLAMVNGGTLLQQASANYSANTTQPAYIGRIGNQGGTANGTDYDVEVYSTTTTPTSTLMKQIELAYLGETGTFGEPLTVTRATTASDMLPAGSATTCATVPCMYWWPTGVARVDSLGLHVEGAATNLVTHSQAFGNASFTNTNVTETNNTAAGVDGTVDADTLQSTVNGGNLLSNTWTASASIYTAAIWAWTASGTQAITLAVRDTTASTETDCNFTANTTRTRYTCSLPSATTPNDALAWKFYPGGTAGTGTVFAWQAQGELGTFATSDILTTTAAVTRNADLVSTPITSAPVWSEQVGSLFLRTTTAFGVTDPSAAGIVFAAQTSGGVRAIDLRTAGGSWQLLGNGGFSSNPVQAIAVGSQSIRGTWSFGGEARACISVNGAATTCQATTSQSHSPTQWNFGNENNANPYVGWISNICIAESVQGCQ
jgi:hypothetical protein